MPAIVDPQCRWDRAVPGARGRGPGRVLGVERKEVVGEGPVWMVDWATRPIGGLVRAGQPGREDRGDDDNCGVGPWCQRKPMQQAFCANSDRGWWQV